jgi:hypothetical protein
MKLNKAYIATLAISILFSCDQISPNIKKEPINLVSLSPHTYEFSNQNGRNRIDYFFIEKDYDKDAKFRENLYNLLNKKQQVNATSDYNLYSIYVYKKTSKINEKFTGSSEDLRGVYDNNLISYSRWNKGNIDIFYFIEDGEVVFDMIKSERVSPSWEFD